MSLIDEARTVRERIVARMRELEPLVREYEELSKVAAEMGIEPGASPSRAAEPVARSLQAASDAAEGPEVAPRPRRSGARGRRPAGRRRAAAGDDIGLRVVEAIRADPGKTVAEYADALGVAPTSLYRPVRELTNAGTVVKRARQLYLP